MQQLNVAHTFVGLCQLGRVPGVESLESTVISSLMESRIDIERYLASCLRKNCTYFL